MTHGRPAPEALQPDHFAFTDDNLDRARRIIAKYPPGKQQSAMLPLLDLAQRQHDNWLPRAAMDYVADFLEVPRIRAYEVASFYSMFETEKVGRNNVAICTNISCWLNGAEDIVRHCEKKLGIKHGESTPDGRVYLKREEECLAGCGGAPMMVINGHYHERLTLEKVDELLDGLE